MTVQFPGNADLAAAADALRNTAGLIRAARPDDGTSEALERVAKWLEETKQMTDPIIELKAGHDLWRAIVEWAKSREANRGMKSAADAVDRRIAALVDRAYEAGKSAAQAVGQESLHTEPQAIELAPCPHCGKAPLLHENDWCEPPEWIVICGCKKTHSDPAVAVAAWNRRVPTQASRVGTEDPVVVTMEEWERIAATLVGAVSATNLSMAAQHVLGTNRIRIGGEKP